MARKKSSSKSFRDAVHASLQLKTGYRNGLQALANHSNKISLGNDRNCSGSVDIDSTVKSLYPQGNRWDYCFCYGGKVYFVEVHSAHTREVSTVIKKLQWLKDWLPLNAAEVYNLKASEPYFWIQSNGFHIAKNSKQFRLLTQNKLMPIAQLKLQ